MNDIESQIAKLEGKIAFLEEEINEKDSKDQQQNKTIQSLGYQLSQMKSEYDQLSEDYNSCMNLLNEQISSREKSVEDEQEKLKQLHEIIHDQQEKLKEKNNEIDNYKNELLKHQEVIIQENNSAELQKSLTDLEKKYKSLEKLYIQQLEINGTLREKFGTLEKEKEKEKENEKEKEKNNEIRIESEENKYDNQNLMENENLELSDQLALNDYDLTKSLEMYDEIINEPIYEPKNDAKMSYDELVNFIIEYKLIDYGQMDDYEIVKTALELLNYIKILLVSENILAQESTHIFESLQNYIGKNNKIAERAKNESRMLEGKRKLKEDIAFHCNYSEPSPRNMKGFDQSFIIENKIKDEKILSKKRKIIMHKEQITCLKGQLRSSETLLKLQEKLDIGLLKSLLKKLFKFLPKLHEKQEKEVELCMKIVGCNLDEYKAIRNINTKKLE